MRRSTTFLAALLAALFVPAPSAAQRTFRIVRPEAPLAVGSVDTVRFQATADNGRRVASPAGRCLSYTPSVLRIEKDVVMVPVAAGRGVYACAWMPGSEGLLIDTASVLVVPAQDEHEPEPDPEPEFRLLVHSGDGQQGIVRQKLHDELVVELRDRQGRLVTVPTDIVWTPSHGELLDSEGTGSDGRAAAVWRLGDHVGQQTLTACTERASCATFIATAVAPDDEWELAVEWCHPRTSTTWFVGELNLLKIEAGVRDSAWVRAVKVWRDGRREVARDAEWDIPPIIRFTPIEPGTPTPCGPA